MSEINGKKIVNNLKSNSTQGPKNSKFVPVKNKTLVTNETVRTMACATDRMRRRKLVNKSIASDDVSPNRAGKTILEDNQSRPKIVASRITSAMSTSFSQYELMRDLSALNCRSGGALSATTCAVACSSSATLYKRELLEKYFRSAEKWNREYNIFESNHNYY